MSKEYRLILKTICSLCGEENHRGIVSRSNCSQEELDAARIYGAGKGTYKELVRNEDHEDLKDCIRYLRSIVDDHNSAIRDLEHPDDKWD